jgi:hypothetical protein
LVNCLLNRDGAITPEFERRLRALGFDLSAARKCLADFCRGGRA